MGSARCAHRGRGCGKHRLAGKSAISGVEALLRWQHPLRGLIAPDLFIPFAEQTGFIREITPWLIRKVVGHATQWRRDGVELVASLNISALDLLNPALIDGLQQLLMQTSLQGEMLCLEITESTLMDHPERAHTHLLGSLGWESSYRSTTMAPAMPHWPM